MITCDEIKEEIIPTNLNEKKTTFKMQNFYILLSFLFITVALLVVVSIYCYLIKYRANQKNLLSIHFTNIKLKIKTKKSNKIKHIDIKSYTHYFFDGIININIFDPYNSKIYKKSYKNILIYYIGCVTIKDSKYVKIINVNPLYLIFSKVNE